MSFILDALKKLEQKRHEGSVPDLMTVHLPASQEPKKRSLLPYVIVLVLLINAGILAALLLPDKTEKQEVVQTTVSRQPESTVIKDEKKADTPELLSSPASSEKEKTPVIEPAISANIISPVPDAPSAVTASDSKGSTAKEQPEPAESVTASDSAGSTAKEQPEPAESVQPVEVPGEPPNETETAAHVGLNPSPREVEILKNTIREEYSSIDDSPQADMRTEEDAEPAAEEKVLEFDQIPSDIKKELPAISIKGHIYSNNPSSRIVNVNGIIIRQGDTVTAGLKVEEITMTGVIFDYGGLRFRMRAF